MTKKKIASNFYTIDSYKWVRENGDFHSEMQSLPGNRLYSGWGTQHPTKITPEDLPEWYVYLSDYRKHGYLNVKGVTAVAYINSPFDNHWLKDADLCISYTLDHFDVPEPTWGRHQNGWMDMCEWDIKNNIRVWGNDILTALKGIMTYSPNIDVGSVMDGIITDYNAYADDSNKWPHNQKMEHLNSREELIKKFLDDQDLRFDLTLKKRRADVTQLEECNDG